MPYRLVDPKQSPRLRAVLHVIAGVATGVFIVGAVFLGVTTWQLVDAVRETQVSNTQRTAQDRVRDEQTAQLAEDAANAAERIEDCTTPGRECFEDGQQRLRGTVASINDYALAAAYCADQPNAQTIIELEACIRVRIAEDRRQQQQ